MPKITQDTSDGYHTFRELYRYRLLYNALLFNEWARLGLYDVHKSTRHHDGELCFGGGWFVVVAQLPTGQISNHYKMSCSGFFEIPERERSAEWDGHTPQDAADRMACFAVGDLPPDTPGNTMLNIEPHINVAGVPEYTPIVDAHGGTTIIRESTAAAAHNPHTDTLHTAPFLWIDVRRDPHAVQDPRSAPAAFNHLTREGAQQLRDQLTHWLNRVDKTIE